MRIRSSTGGNASTLLTVGMAGLSLLGTIYFQFSRNDRETVQRVSTLESHRQDDSERLERIENKLDLLIYRLADLPSTTK